MAKLSSVLDIEGSIEYFIFNEDSKKSNLKTIALYLLCGIIIKIK